MRANGLRREREQWWLARRVFEASMSAFDADVSDSKAIFYERATGTWVGGPPLQFYEDAIFQPSTFCSLKVA